MNIRYINSEEDKAEGRPHSWAGIKFLNAYPLIRGLAEALPGQRQFLGSPAECASLLDSGKVDLALVPLVTAVTNSWPFLGDVGIACSGPVTSVKFVYNTDLRLMKTYKPDPASGTSNLLARLLFNIEFGRDLIADTESEEAEIVIGDRAFETDTADQIDLGQAWFRETGMPFVFGVWAARTEKVLELYSDLLIGRLQDNLRERELLVHEASKLTGKLINVEDYLYRKLHFELTQRDHLGIKTFIDLAYKYDMIPTDKLRMFMAVGRTLV
jgi:predicted solute-binding protein